VTTTRRLSVIHVLAVVNLVACGVGLVMWLPLSLAIGFATDGSHSSYAKHLYLAWNALGVASLVCLGVGLAGVVWFRTRDDASPATQRLAVGAETVALILFVAACAWLIPLVAHTAHW
jgi:hypothetical protein